MSKTLLHFPQLKRKRSLLTAALATLFILGGGAYLRANPTVMRSLLSVLSSESAPVTGEISMSSGTQTITVGTEPVTLYDAGGAAAAPEGGFFGYTKAEPALDGYCIQATVEEVALSGTDKLVLVSGTPYASSYFPPSSPLETITPSSTLTLPKQYTSDDASGALSVWYKGAGEPGAGFKITLRAVPLPAMQIAKAEWRTTDAYDSYPGGENVPAGRLCVEVENRGDALSLTSIDYTLNAEAVPYVADVKVYPAKTYNENAKDDTKGVSLSEIAAAGSYTFAQPVALEVGKSYNYFFELSFKSSIPAGTQVRFVPGKVHTNRTQQAVTASEDKPITIENAYATTAEGLSVSVTEPVTIYDNGGKYGKITPNYTGKLTLTPGKSGQKVCVDFTTIDLFKRSSVDKYEYVSVYNGTEVRPENLIVRLNEEKKFAVYSTAPDGALTLVQESNTGTPHNGFEATASLFTPSPMTLTGISATTPQGESVVSGATNVRMLDFVLTTQNTEPALTNGTFRFSTNGSGSVTAKAYLYTTGATAAGTPVKVGETETTAAEFDITAAGTLLPGDNYFYLVYDVQPRLPNNSQVDAALLSVTYGGKTTTAQNAARTQPIQIDNTIVATLGTQQVTIYPNQEYNFLPETGKYSETYTTADGERTVTFTSSSEEYRLELDFSLFELFYSSYSWAGKPTFTVYDGADNQAPVLFKVDGSSPKEDYTTVPERIRSTGKSLTVVFDTGGGRTAKGWKAVVKRYKSQPMQVQSVAAAQAETEQTRLGAQNVPILYLNITTAGDQNPLSLESVQVDLKGSAKYLSAVSLLQGESVVETVAVKSAETKEVTFRSQALKDIVLKEGLNQLTIAAAISMSAPQGEDLDFKLLQVQIQGKAAELTTPDPDGARPVIAVYEQPKEGTEHVVTVSQSLTYYDDGGAEGRYGKDLESAVTFVPERPGQVIRMTIREFAINTSHVVNLYSGAYTPDMQNNASVQPLFRGSNYITLMKSGVRYYASTAPDGKMCLYFNSRKSTRVDAGWSILVEAVDPSPMAVTSATVTPQSAPREGVRRGSSVVAMRLALLTDGNQGAVSPESVTVKYSTGSISAVRLYSSGSEDAFSDTRLLAEHQVGVAPKATLKIPDGAAVIDKPTTTYLWLVADIKPDAKADEPVSLSVTEVKAKGADAITLPEPNSYTTTVSSKGLAGRYTIGASQEADYATVAEAAKALNEQGVCGPVTFAVEPGTYSGTLRLDSIAGASPANPIVFEGTGTSRTDAVLTAESYVTPEYGNPAYGMITVHATPWITFRNLSFKCTDTSYPAVILVENRATDFTLENCRIEAPESTSSNYRQSVRLIKFTSDNQAGNSAHRVKLLNNSFVGGYIGAEIGGASYVYQQPLTGAVVQNNEFTNNSSKALYLNKAADVQVLNNKITYTAAAGSSLWSFDYIASHNITTQGNLFYLAPQGDRKPTVTAVNVRPVSVVSGIKMIGNSITIENGSANSEAFELENISSAQVLHNSVYLKSEAPAVTLGKEVSGLLMANNLFASATPGVLITASPAPTGLQLRHNLFSHPTQGEDAFVVKSAADSYRAAELTQIGDEGSVVLSTLIAFAGDRILYPTDMDQLPKPFDLGADKPQYDIIGTPRTRHTVGAYEEEENLSAEAPVLTDVKLISATHQTAQVSLVSDQIAEMRYLAVPTQDEAPNAEKLQGEGSKVSLAKKNVTEINLSALTPETEYTLYGIATGLLNGRTSQVVKLLSFATTYTPSEVADFEEEVIVSDGMLTDGTNSFVGFTLTTEPTNQDNHVARLTQTGTVTVTNAKGKIPQKGFSLMADRAVQMQVDGATAVTLPATHGEWIYVPLTAYEGLHSFTLESHGTLWLDNYNAPAQAVALQVPDAVLNLGQQATLAPVVTLGVAPYSYAWSTGADTPTLTVAPTQTTEYTLTVTDAEGHTATATATVYVNGLLGELRPATFESLTLPEGQAFEQKRSFADGSFLFRNHYNAEWKSFSGFTYANSKDSSFDVNKLLTQQYNAAPGGGHESEAYAVGYCTGNYPEYGLYNPELTLMGVPEEGAELTGCYITNTAWGRDFVLTGATSVGTPKPFADGDYALLYIEGDNGKKVEVALADYRDGKSEVLTSWQWVDLSPLGKVHALSFSIISTQSYFPTYFALDDLQATPQGEADPAQSALELQVVQADVTSLQVQWKALPQQASYSATIAPEGDALRSGLRSAQIVRNGQTMTATYTDLLPDTSYRITVEALVANVDQAVYRQSVVAKTLPDPAATPLPESISFKEQELTLQEGTQGTLTLLGAEQVAAERIQWTSSNHEVATVTPNGVVTALKPGATTVVVRISGTPLVATSTVIVTKPQPQGITISEGAVELHRGERRQLTAVVTPEAFASVRLIWRSSDETVATVSETGVVQAVGKGVAAITVQPEGSALSASCPVTVLAGVGVEDPAAQTIRLYPNPASEQFSVSGVTGTLRLLSSNGKCVLTLPQYAGETVEIASLPAGLYVVTVTDEDGTAVSRTLYKR